MHTMKVRTIAVVMVVIIAFSIPLSTISGDTLIGIGSKLDVKGHCANGYLTLNGEQYQISNMTILITQDRSSMRLAGYLDNNKNLILMATGVNTKGIKYEFYGTLIKNSSAVPVQFELLFAYDQVGNRIKTIPKPELPQLHPMMMLIEHYGRVYVGYVYAITVKIFNSAANPEKNFFQFYGGVQDVNVTATLFDQEGKVFHKFSGVTDAKGIYVASVLMPDLSYPDQTYRIVVNASKDGYLGKSVTLPVVVLHRPHEGKASVEGNGTVSSGAIQDTQNLITLVNSMGLPQGLVADMDPLLQSAVNSLEAGQNKTAVNKINEFISMVDAQSGKKIPTSQANQLIEAARNIIGEIP